MFFCFDPSALHVTLCPEESIDIASTLGFAAVSLDQKAVCARNKAERAALRETMRARKLLAGPWSIPFEWRGDETEFQTGLVELKSAAKTMAELGPSAATTWIAPFSSDLDWNGNLKLHVKRLRQIAEVLHASGLSLGLEFLGTRKLRQGFRFEFVHSVRGVATLCQKLGAPNAGMVLDLWSAHASGQGPVDLDTLEGVPIMLVQIGDTPDGATALTLDEGDRCLPGTSDTVENARVLAELAERGYQGPVAVEAYAGDMEHMTPPEKAQAALAALWNVLKTPAPATE